MPFKELDTVVLRRDLPDVGLRAGDLGAIVDMGDGATLEVEFVTASGRTEALVSVSESDLRAIAETDLVSVRSVRRSA